MKLRMARLARRCPSGSGTAGNWLIRGQGLLLQQRATDHGWRVPEGQARQQLLTGHHRWLCRHGLDRAEFALRRDALTAVEHALRHDPLPQLDWIWADD